MAGKRAKRRDGPRLKAGVTVERRRSLCFIFALLAVLAACTQTEAPRPHLTELTALPGWQEDAGLDAAPALLASCGVIETLSSDQALGIGGAPTEWTHPCAAIRQARDGVALKQTLAAQFIALDPGAGTSALVTGYYEPELDGSRARDAAHPYPLYRLPPKPTQFDRSQIDAGALKGRKLELLWVSDRIDAFFLHVQGSGRVRL
jgi:membrane-bound lytic murein transglycosylase A